MKKTILNISTLRENSVGANHIECSVCGKYNNPSHYNNDNNPRGAMTRTNCTSCFNLTHEKMKELSAKTKEIKNSSNYTHAARALRRKLIMIRSSTKVSDLIEALQKLPPESKVVIAQYGYYCSSDEPYGDIYSEPKELSNSGEAKIYEIGRGGSKDYC